MVAKEGYMLEQKHAICSTVDTVYCVCKMINDRNKEMVKCLTCLKWFHGECMDVDCADEDVVSGWNCHDCNACLDDLRNF